MPNHFAIPPSKKTIPVSVPNTKKIINKKSSEITTALNDAFYLVYAIKHTLSTISKLN
jgi:hypothetical protein